MSSSMASRGPAGSIRKESRTRSSDDTLLVSVMLANNEIGVIQPIARNRRALPRRAASLFHCDATQAVGKIPVNVRRVRRRSDELFGATKSMGPKGVGALYVRRSGGAFAWSRRSTAAARNTASAAAR